MNNFFNKISSIFILLLSVFNFSQNFSSQVFAVGQTPEVILDKTDEAIPLDRKDPFFVYFNYGDPGVNYEVKDVQIDVKLESDKLLIDTENVYDIFDDKNPTNTVRCDAGSGVGAKVSPSLITHDGLKYGPGSARENGGTKTSNLIAKQVGCLKVGLKVNPVSNAPGLVSIIYKIIGTNNKFPFYKSADEQPVKKVLFFVGQKQDCGSGQEWKMGKCRTVCGENMYRGLDGICYTKSIICKADEEVYNGNCVLKCSEKESRSAFGDCKPIEEPISKLAGNVLQYTLIAIIVLFIINFIVKKLGKRK